eukprot:42556_1
MHNTNSNGNHSDEYDIQYDDSDDDMPQPNNKPWSPFGIKQSKSHQHAVKLAEDSNSGSNKGRPRGGSDTEIIAPSPSSPYHPNNNATFAMYKPIKQAKPITRPQAKTIVNNHPNNIQRDYRKKVSTKAQSNAQFMSPPRNPYGKRKFPQKIVPSKGSNLDPNQQFPAPPTNGKHLNNYNNEHKVSKSQNKKLSFDLQQILLPGQDSKENIHDDDSEEDIPLSQPTMNDGNSYKIQNIPKISPNISKIDSNNRKKMRRNSDTIVWTSTTVSVIEDSTFMDVMNNPPDKRMHHYRSRIRNAQQLEKNLKEATNVTPISASNTGGTPDSMTNNVFSDRDEMSYRKHNLSLVDETTTTKINMVNSNVDIINEYEYRKRRSSAPETPTNTNSKSTPGIPDMDDNIMQSFPKELPRTSQFINMRQKLKAPKNVSQIHHNNKKLIDKLLGFKGHTWNFDNEYVYVYLEQCKNVCYERIVPPLIDIMYPTMISSLALPASVKTTSYRATIKYNLSSFISVEEKIAKYSPIMNGLSNKEERVFFLEFTFTIKTTIRMAIEEITHKIKQNHVKFSRYISKLYNNCFVLKVCGREEYIKVNDKNNKIISLNHIRNCIRKNEVQNLELVLLYDDSLNDLNDIAMRKTLRNSYNNYYYNSEQEQEQKHQHDSYLEYENLGFNCVMNTLYNTINKPMRELHNNLHQLHKDVENELLWLQKKIGSVYENTGDQTTVAYTPHTREHAYSTFKSELNEFEWDEVTKDAILLPEFEHPVEFRIDSLTNIMLCPRFRMKNNEYFVYVLRIELMFGIHVFEQCSWDITIPKNKISNNIEMPKKYCTFSTDDNALNYASLPREAVWCFTLYGIKKDQYIAKQNEQSRKKEAKKKKKNEAKILRAFIKKQATVKSLGGLGGDGSKSI